MKYTFFWQSFLSQWTYTEFSDGEQTYNCCEQYMMYQKAKLFNDKETANMIMLSKTPREQKALGRQVKNFDLSIWNKNKEQIVYNGNYLRFSQNPEHREKLFKTAGTTLVEASPYDKIWGIGLTKDDPRALDESQWEGQNLLGKILTKVRDDLMDE